MDIYIRLNSIIFCKDLRLLVDKNGAKSFNVAPCMSYIEIIGFRGDWFSQKHTVKAFQVNVY